MALALEEWLNQADYDLATAQAMLENGRNIYAVFMAHLAVEKALKGVYHKKFAEFPPRTHSLMFLLKKIEMDPSLALGEFMAELDQASVATRYPEELFRLQTAYPSGITQEIVEHAREVLVWVKKMF